MSRITPIWRRGIPASRGCSPAMMSSTPPTRSSATPAPRLASRAAAACRWSVRSIPTRPNMRGSRRPGCWSARSARARLTASPMAGLPSPTLISSLLERRLIRHLESVTLAMGSYGGEPDTQYAVRHSGVSLRRGLDRELFSPARRDRAWFEARFGIPPGHLVLMYAGKLNAGKNVPLLAPVLQQLQQMGVAAHLFCAGA